mmetsp:Transcript_22339/g.69108  ORF Transcript_22339/g.69108 Transcript_22339/m.69108 type:complete len:188 (-) Transcript_22339:216-779(-)
MGNAVLNVVDGVGGAVNAVVGGVGGALGGLKNACFPGRGGDGGPGGAASRGSLHASGIDARAPTADPPPYQPPTPASGSAVIGAGSGGQQMLVASSTGMSVPSGTPEEKGGAGKLARKITGAVVTVAAAALAITLVAKGGCESDDIEEDEDKLDVEENFAIMNREKKDNGLVRAIKGFFAWGRGLYP